MLPTRSNIGSLAGQSGFITVNQTTRIPIQTTTTQDVEVNSIVTPEVGVGNCRCTETVGIMWQPEGLENAHYVTKWSSPDQGFYWQNDVKNEGNPMPIMRLHKDGHLHVEGDLHCNRLHEQSPSTSAVTTDGGTVTGDLTVNGTVTATTLSVPSVLSTAADTLEALSGLAVTGALTTANGNVDTRLAALEAAGGGGGGALPFFYAEFTVTMNTAKTIFQAPNTNVITPTNVIDPQSMWASNVLTIPASGVYKVTFVLQMTRGSLSTETPILSVYKDVDTLVKQIINLRAIELPFSPAGNRVQYDLYMQLTTSDTIYMKIDGTGYGGTLHNTGSYIAIQQVA